MRRDSSQAWMADTELACGERGLAAGVGKGRLQGRRGKGREGRWAEAPEDPHTRQTQCAAVPLLAPTWEPP